MRFNRNKFFSGMREAFGELVQKQVDAVMALIALFEADRDMVDLRWIAYALATIKHETANTYRPIAEYGKGKGKAYGKPDPETGQTYYGRGFVQLTWRDNYEKLGELLGVDLVNHPDKAMELDTAYHVLSVGMRQGLFTGKKLSDYIGDETDYLHARKIINAMDKASLIAGYAEQFQTIIENAIMDEESAPAPEPPPTEPPVTHTESLNVSKVVSNIAANDQVKQIASQGVTKLATAAASSLGVGAAGSAAGGADASNPWPWIIFACVLIVLAAGVLVFILWHKHKKEETAAIINADPARHDIRFVKQ